MEMAAPARIVSIARRRSDADLHEDEVRNAIEEGLGLQVSEYEGELPTGYDRGRVYRFAFMGVVALELIDSESELHMVVVRRGVPFVPPVELAAAGNVVLARSFDFAPVDSLLG